MVRAGTAQLPGPSARVESADRVLMTQTAQITYTSAILVLVNAERVLCTVNAKLTTSPSAKIKSA